MNAKRIIMRVAASYGVLSAAAGVYVLILKSKEHKVEAKKKAEKMAAQLDAAYAHVYAMDVVITKLLNGKYDQDRDAQEMNNDFKFEKIAYFLKKK
jgi:hypothetical protein